MVTELIGVKMDAHGCLCVLIETISFEISRSIKRQIYNKTSFSPPPPPEIYSAA